MADGMMQENPEMMEPAMQPLPPDKPGLFRHAPQQVDLGPISSELNSLSARMRIIEERYVNLRKKDQLVEQNMIVNHKNISVEIKAINAELVEVKREIEDMRNKIKLMVNEFQTFSRKDELKVLERYVNLWEPLKYCTPGEVEKIVRRILDENKGTQ